MSRTPLVLAAIAAIAAIALGAGMVASAAAAGAGRDAILPLVAQTVLEGPITPDAGEGGDPASLPRSPAGHDCLDDIVRTAGPMSLCWDAYRYPFDGDPTKDYYRFETWATFGGGTGTGVRWASIRAQLVGDPAGNVFEVWPVGAFEGPCEQVVVATGGGDPLPPATMCGRTDGIEERAGGSHRVTWSCAGVCLIAGHETRSLTLHHWVGVPQGTIPTWEIYADLGG